MIGSAPPPVLPEASGIRAPGLSIARGDGPTDVQRILP